VMSRLRTVMITANAMTVSSVFNMTWPVNCQNQNMGTFAASLSATRQRAPSSRKRAAAAMKSAARR
jgi:hypothetical protein